MLNLQISKYSNYIVPFRPSRSLHGVFKKSSKIKRFYKHLFRDSVFLKRHRIQQYTLICKHLKTAIIFNSNLIILKHNINNTKSKNIFFLTCVQSFFKNKYSHNQYLEFQKLFFYTHGLLHSVHFKYYWLTAFLMPTIPSKFYYFTNKIKFFSNQRLIKQPVLLMYNTVSKSNYYSPYLNIFKGLLLRKNVNSLFFFKNVVLQVQPKYNSNSYFFRHINFLKKFTTQSYLKLMPA